MRNVTIGPQTIVSSAQNITAAWVDLGPELGVSGWESIGLWVDIDINDAQNVRLRALAKHTSGGDNEYSLPIKTVGTSDVKVEDEYLELNADADQKLLLGVVLGGLVPFVQFQVVAGTAGASAGQVETAVVTGRYGGG